MKRIAVLGTIVALGSLSIAVSAYQAPAGPLASGAGRREDREGQGQPLHHHRLEPDAPRHLHRRQHRRVRHREGVVIVDTKLAG